MIASGEDEEGRKGKVTGDKSRRQDPVGFALRTVDPHNASNAYPSILRRTSREIDSRSVHGGRERGRISSVPVWGREECGFGMVTMVRTSGASVIWIPKTRL